MKRLRRFILFIMAPVSEYAKFQHVTQRRSGVPAAASRNQFFRRLCHAPQPSQGYRRQAATAGGSVEVCSPGLSGSVWSGLTAVRKVVERMVAARRGGHPAPPVGWISEFAIFKCHRNKRVDGLTP